jgi:hypothetical protein
MMAGGIGAGKLSDKAVKAFVARAELGKKLADGDGLHLFITPAGGSTWRIKYRLDGKEKIYSIGPYPLVGLAAARVELVEVKALLLDEQLRSRGMGLCDQVMQKVQWIVEHIRRGVIPWTIARGGSPRCRLASFR